MRVRVRETERESVWVLQFTFNNTFTFCICSMKINTYQSKFPVASFILYYIKDLFYSKNITTQTSIFAYFAYFITLTHVTFEWGRSRIHTFANLFAIQCPPLFWWNQRSRNSLVFPWTTKKFLTFQISGLSDKLLNNLLFCLC